MVQNIWFFSIQQEALYFHTTERRFIQTKFYTKGILPEPNVSEEVEQEILYLLQSFIASSFGVKVREPALWPKGPEFESWTTITDFWALHLTTRIYKAWPCNGKFSLRNWKVPSRFWHSSEIILNRIKISGEKRILSYPTVQEWIRFS